LSVLKIPTAKVYEPLLAPARYKGAYGGRGSGKSHFFGELLVETCQAERGTSAVCIREAQRSLAQSSKRLIESKIASLGVGSGFRLYSDKIETPGDGVIIFRGMHQHSGENNMKEFSVAYALGFGVGGAFIWFCKDWIQKLVIGANALSAKLHAQADALATAVKKV
jgi:phage terminase large subunit